MVSPQQRQRALQAFIQAARRGRFGTTFSEPDTHCFHLADSLISFARFIPRNELNGMCAFLELAVSDPDGAAELVGINKIFIAPTSKNLKITQPQKFPRSLK